MGATGLATVRRMTARTFVVRVWLPDRPGALGQVASRIGAVHGDVTAIDILERGGGRVIDELAVALPEDVSIDLLAKEINAVDGVSVEHIRPVAGERPDSATSVLQLAAEVAETASGDRLEVLVAGLLVVADADWAVAVRDGELVHPHGASAGLRVAGRVPRRERPPRPGPTVRQRAW